ncbi:MAG: TSUP family transporter, partial [Actinomycetota bacterium]|nr:TSUP family transporter [Actinomycetota bacterium]
MSSGVLILFLLGVGVGAVIQGSLGFGFSFVVVPLLGLLRPEALPATVLIMSMPMTMTLALRERGDIEAGGLVRLTAGRVVGTVVGVWLVRSWPTDELAVLTGAALLAGVAVSAFAPGFEAGGRTQLALGMVSGVMGTTAAVGGPPA